MVKNPPEMQETWVRSLGWEYPLGKGKATHSIIFWPGEFHRLNSPWGHKESDMTEVTEHIEYEKTILTPSGPLTSSHSVS